MKETFDVLRFIWYTRSINQRYVTSDVFHRPQLQPLETLRNRVKLREGPCQGRPCLLSLHHCMSLTTELHTHLSYLLEAAGTRLLRLHSPSQMPLASMIVGWQSSNLAPSACENDKSGRSKPCGIIECICCSRCMLS